MSDMLIALDPSKSDDKGVFGDIYWRGTHMGVVCGQPWNNNKPGHSSIPPGPGPDIVQYECRPHDTPDHPDTVVFVNPAVHIYESPDDVPPSEAMIGRSECLLHNANVPSQLKGCFAPGQARVWFDQFVDHHGVTHPAQFGVTSSVDTMDRIRELWGDRRFTAEVRWKVQDQAES